MLILGAGAIRRWKMSNDSQSANARDLNAIVEKYLPRLKALSLFLNIYGGEQEAATLREILTELESATLSHLVTGESTDFIVNATFKVTRRQVAELLSLGVEIQDSYPFWIVDYVEPKQFRFRTDDKRIVKHLDYPLNEGGALTVLTKSRNAGFRVDLASIARGLSIMAANYPRHFADFLNDNADRITASVFLQCCLFGEVIHG
jgi:hypothetical protein